MRYHCQRRTGASMLEALIYVSLSAVLVSLTAQWFHVVFQVASHNKLRQRQHVSLKRLSSDLRTDAISASSLSLKSPKQLSLITTARENVIYRISPGQVDRIVGDSGNPARQNSYRDLDDLRLEFVDDDGDSAGVFKNVLLNVYRPVRQKKPKAAALRPVAVENGTETRLVQVRCCPILVVQKVAE